eukprot:365303-Chlamydomonas_euryale.AAC.68
MALHVPAAAAPTAYVHAEIVHSWNSGQDRQWGDAVLIPSASSKLDLDLSLEKGRSAATLPCCLAVGHRPTPHVFTGCVGPLPTSSRDASAHSPRLRGMRRPTPH